MKCQYYQQAICKSCDELELGLTQSAHNKFKRIQAHYPEQEIHPIVTVTNPEGSRNKAKLIVGGTVDQPQIGFINFEQQLTEVMACPLYHEDIHDLLILLKPLITKYNLIPYDITAKKGELKGLIIFRSHSDGKIMLRFSMRSMEAFERLKKLYHNELIGLTNINVVTMNVQPEHKAALEGEKELVLSSNQTLRIQFENLQLHLGPKSFFQTNSEIAQKLYSTIGQEVKKLNIQNALELYCGVGAISLVCAKYLKSIGGVDISQEAITFATMSAQENQIKNAQFFADDALHFYQNHHQDYDVVILNPPRRGLGTQLTQLLKGRQVPYIIYSSCNPESQKNDLDELQTHYSITYISPFDMFPLTSHVENLIILAKK